MKKFPLVLILFVSLFACNKDSEDLKEINTDYSFEKDVITIAQMVPFIQARTISVVNHRQNGIKYKCADGGPEFKDTIKGSYTSFGYMCTDQLCDLDYVVDHCWTLSYSDSLLNGTLRDSVNFEDHLRLNNVKVSGALISTQKHYFIDNDEMAFDIKFNGGFLLSDGNSISFKIQAEMVMMGYSTEDESDDQYKLFISTADNSETTTFETIDTLIYKVNCLKEFDPVAGSIQTQNKSSGITRLIDFGSGECDNKVLISDKDGNEFVHEMY